MQHIEGLKDKYIEILSKPGLPKEAIDEIVHNFKRAKKVEIFNSREVKDIKRAIKKARQQLEFD